MFRFDDGRRFGNPTRPSPFDAVCESLRPALQPSLPGVCRNTAVARDHSVRDPATSVATANGVLAADDRTSRGFESRSAPKKASNRSLEAKLVRGRPQILTGQATPAFAGGSSFMLASYSSLRPCQAVPPRENVNLGRISGVARRDNRSLPDGGPLRPAFSLHLLQPSCR